MQHGYTQANKAVLPLNLKFYSGTVADFSDTLQTT